MKFYYHDNLYLKDIIQKIDYFDGKQKVLGVLMEGIDVENSYIFWEQSTIYIDAPYVRTCMRKTLYKELVKYIKPKTDIDYYLIPKDHYIDAEPEFNKLKLQYFLEQNN